MKKIDYKLNKGLPDMFQVVGVDLSEINEQRIGVSRAFTVDEDSDGLAQITNTNWFFEHGGYLWAYQSDGDLLKLNSTWALDEAVGSSIGNGACSFDGKIFLATNTDISYSADAGTSWDTDWWTTVAGGTALTTGIVHPLKEVRGKMLIGDGKYVRTWDGQVGVSNALVLPDGFSIKGIERTPYYASIMAVGKGGSRIFLWDTVSSTYNYTLEVANYAIGQYAVDADLYVLNNKGVLFKQSGDVMTPIKKFPDDVTLSMNPQGMTKSGSEILMAINGSSSTRSLYGVWAYNIQTNDLYLKHLISSRELGSNGNNVQLYSIYNYTGGTSDVLYLGTKTASTGYYNIEKLSTTAYITKGSHIIIPMNNNGRKKRLIKLVLDFYKTRGGNILVSYSDTPGYFSTTATQTGTSDSAFTTAADIADEGDMVMILTGARAGDVRFVTGQSGTYTYTVDSNFSGALANGDLVGILKFKKIATISSSDTVISKMLRIGKYIDDYYIRLDILTDGSIDTKLRNLSVFYNESKN